MRAEDLIKIWEKNHWGFYEGDSHGVVGFGGDLSTTRLREAYSTGVFPWPQDKELVWFCPPKRGVLFFDELKVHKRLQRKYKNSHHTYSMNKVFVEVMSACAKAKRRGQAGTWITPEMLKAYEKFHKEGNVLSFECWRGETLVGGLYGVATFEKGKLKYFSGESVFGDESDVAKFCFLKCIEYLKTHGLEWMDIQMVTALTEDFGGRYIDRQEFLLLLLV